MRNTVIVISLLVFSCFLIIGLQGCGAEGVPDPTTTTTTPATTTTTLPAPTGLVATAESLQVNLTWTAVASASAYNLYWSDSSSTVSTSSAKVANLATNSYTHTGLTNEVIYYYRVAAIDAASAETSLSATAVATPDTVGTLDTSFNGTGYIVSDTDFDSGNDVVIDSSGRLLVCGSRSSHAAVWRYNPDGTLDTTFASLGVWQESVPSYDNTILLDGSGRILVVGWRNAGTQYMAIWRLLTNGSLDPTFGTGGLVTDTSAANANASGLCLDTSGNLYAAGYYDPGNKDMVIWRYNANGGSGTLTTFTGGANDDYALSLGLDYSGRLMVAGYTGGASSDQMALLRFTPSPLGLDFAFNGSGLVQNLAGGDRSDAYHLTITPSNHYITCGMSRVGGNIDMAVWRFNSDGSLDTGFNGTGYFTHGGAAGGSGADYAARTIADNSGRLLVSGYSTNASANFDIVVWRLKSGGTLDPAFNGTGYTTHGNAAGGNGTDACSGIKFDHRRRLVVAGRSDATSGGVTRMVVWRFK